MGKTYKSRVINLAETTNFKTLFKLIQGHMKVFQSRSPCNLTVDPGQRTTQKGMRGLDPLFNGLKSKMQKKLKSSRFYREMFRV